MVKTFEDFGIHLEEDATGEVQLNCHKLECLNRSKSHLKTLAVNVEEGAWFCHHCGWKGGLHLDKIMKKPIKRQARKPIYKTPITTIHPLSDKARSWLNNRGITDEVILRNEIGTGTIYDRDKELETPAIMFPYFREGELVNIKSRGSNKKFSAQSGCELIPYGLDDLSTEDGYVDEVIIVEGELDRLALEVAGYTNVVSVPNGAPTEKEEVTKRFDPFVNNQQYFETAKKIILAVDNDVPGQRLEEEFARRFDKGRCWRVTWPDGCKDANDVLLEYGKEALSDCLKESYPWPLDDITYVDDISDQIDDIFQNGLPPGLDTGWGCLDKIFSLAKGRVTLVTGIPSHGKAESLDTVIPTINGMSTMGELRVGDVVFDENGNPCNIIAKTPIMYGRTCYEVTFSDGTTSTCDAEHLWLTRDDKARRSERMAKKNNRLADRELKVKGSDQRNKRTYPKVRPTREISDTLNSSSDGRLNHAVKVLSKPLQITKNNLPIDPYTLGAWLGDGTSKAGEITCGDPEVADRIRFNGFTVTNRSNPINYGILKFRAIIKKENLFGNKHIPNDYLFSNTEDRLNLLQGLMDTDGSCEPKYGRCEFSSTNLNLAEGVKWLVSSLGMIPVLLKERAKLNGKDYGPKYRVTFTPHIQVFSVPRKAARVKVSNAPKPRLGHRTIVSCKKVESAPVQCISVDSPSNLYLTSEACIPTHNSSFVEALLVNMTKRHHWRHAIFSPEHYPIALHFMRFASIFTGKQVRKKEDVSNRKTKMQLNDLTKAKRVIGNNFFWIEPRENEGTLEGILDRATNLVYSKGINCLVIDPWNEVEVDRGSMNETDYVSMALSKIKRWARRHDTHVFVIAHPTKLQRGADGEYPVPTPYDIAGSANWRNKADNCITIHRDLTGEEKNVVSIYVQKVKWTSEGETGTVCVLKYDIKTARFIELEEDEDEEI